MTISPILILQARAEARAILYREHELEFDEATAPLRDYALATGLVDQIGAAGVVAIINTAFGSSTEPRDDGNE